MVTSVLHDSMKRSVNILPSICRFGFVRQGEDVEMSVSLKNEDGLSQRIHIKPTQDKRLVVKQESYGAIAPGMTRRLIVAIQAGTAGPATLGRLKEEIQVVTKSDVFKLPVEAEILSEEAYAQKMEELAAAAKQQPVANSRVRTRLRSSIAQGRQQSVLEAHKQSLAAEEKKSTAQRLGDDLEERKDSQDVREGASNNE